MKNRVLTFLIIMSIIGLVVSGCSDKDVSARNSVSEKTAKMAILEKNVNRTLMRVDNLSCGSCLTAISQKLSNFEGVVGLGANLNQGLVGVDHAKTLESKKIADAITSIGYPATILSVTEIDPSESYASPDDRQTQQYGGGCCGSAGYSTTVTGDNKKGSNFSSKENDTSAGCPYAGSVRSRGCYASSSSWKELVNKFSGRSDTTQK